MIQDDIINDLYKKTAETWFKALEEYVIKNLADNGFLFTSKEEFLKFCKERITKVTVADRFDEHYFFVDYIDHENSGIYIGGFSDKTEIRTEGSTVYASIGKNLKDYEETKTKI